MSAAPDDGGAAFPVMVNQIDQPGSSEIVLEHSGMSLRDYFAAAALTGIIAQSASPLWRDLAHKEANKKGELNTQDTFARQAYEHADAMIEARKGKK